MAFQKLTVDEVVETADEKVLAPALRPSAIGVVVGVPDRLPHPQPVDTELRMSFSLSYRSIQVTINELTFHDAVTLHPVSTLLGSGMVD